MALATLPQGEDKRAAVRAMFDRIAPRYDLLNRLLTGRLDQRWRRRALAAVAVGPGDRVLDLACGTGDLAVLARSRGARVVGADFAAQMLRRARQRGRGLRLVQADAEALPLASGTLDVVVCGFALRNFVGLAPVFAELARVLRPGGRFALLDVDRPDARLVRACHSAWFDRVVPWVGGLVSDRAAYRYLPESTTYLPDGPELAAQLARAGFARIGRERLLLGAAQLLTGVRV